MPWTRQPIDSGGQPIDYTTEAHRSPRMLKAITVHLDAAPTTSENLVITQDSGFGAQYDVAIYTLDLSLDSTVDILLTDINLPFYPGDSVRVTYANTDGAIIGIQILFSDWWS